MDKNFYEIFEDKSFIKWVKGEKIEKWDNFLIENPDKKEYILKAKEILSTILEVDNKKIINESEKESMWINIQNSIKEKETITKNLRKIAAIFIPLVVLSITFYIYKKSSIGNFLINKELKYTTKYFYTKNNKIVLITSDNTYEHINKSNSIIAYSNNGETNINREKILKQNISNKKTEFNKIIVPYGKRSEIIFSDGSKMFLNSGSYAVYPVNFGSKKREIYVEGEAYFNVKHYDKWPFIVKTKNIEVEVLGTTFNVSSYDDEKEVKVVLVEGKVQAKVGLIKKYQLKPGDLLIYNQPDKKTTIRNVDVIEYISWKDGWMLCKNENLSNILKRLSRYYNIQFEYSEEDINILKLTGKLDLKENIMKVLETISKAVPITFFKVEENKIAIVRDESSEN